MKRQLGKAFAEIPGPRVLPFIGASWKYLPFIGDWDVSRLDVTGALKLNEFGPIVREELSKDLRLCHVFLAEDIEGVYKAEGRYPQRRSHLALNHYRNTRKHLYNTGGLLPTNGEEWWRLRSAFQKHISTLHDVRHFLPDASTIISEFIEEALPSYESTQDFLPLANRLYLELMWMYMFGKRLKSFSKANMSVDSIPSRLIEAAEFVNLSTLQTDNTEFLWKKLKTPTYRRMENYLSFIERIVFNELDEVYDCKARVEACSGGYLLEKYISIPTVDRKDVNGMAVDLVLGGVDTTAYTTGFLLYNLSRRRDVQRKLHEESKALVERRGGLSVESLNECTFTRAALKESFRLNPISIGVSRYLLADTFLHGYLIPKGTLMMTQNLVACRNEEYFPNAEEYVPERWLKDSPHYRAVSPYLVLPFSHGPRTCIARRLAEQNLLTLLLLVLGKYSIDWRGKESLGIVTPLICKPDKPLNFKFTPFLRNN